MVVGRLLVGVGCLEGGSDRVELGVLVRIELKLISSSKRWKITVEVF